MVSIIGDKEFFSCDSKKGLWEKFKLSLPLMWKGFLGKSALWSGSHAKCYGGEWMEGLAWVNRKAERCWRPHWMNLCIGPETKLFIQTK